MIDLINNPDHYNKHPSGVECIQVAEHMTFNLGNAIKYIWRAAYKHKQIEDLKKARWYIDREIERLEPGSNQPIEESNFTPRTPIKSIRGK